jgi:hypothetical protein
MRANQPALEMVNKTQVAPETTSFARWRAVWIGLAALIVITPIGLLAPGTAWGEWGAQGLTNLGLSFIPKGLEQLSGLWSAPMAGYNVPALGNANLGYVLSAAVGIIIIIGVVWLFSMLVTSGKKVTVEVPTKK